MLATALAFAIVTQDQTNLRAAPRDSATQQAVLWQGDSLEIRGTKGDFLEVYDHRHERPGFVRASRVRVQRLDAAGAPGLLAVVRFVRDTPGAETLGIAYAAAYLRAAPPDAIDGEVFEAIGAMADRLARRASAARQGAIGEAIAAHLEVAGAYGVRMISFERDGQIQLCYDGDANRRALALSATPEQKALAALALTRHECVEPTLTPVERFAFDNWRAEALDRVELRDLPEVLKNRIRMRRAGVWASLAYQRMRRPDLGQEAARQAAERAIDELAAVNKSELAETDAYAYNDAAVRVGASRWAAEAIPVGPANTPNAAAHPRATLSVAMTPGQPGETCVHLVDAKHDVKNALFTRCTYGIPWQASAAPNAQGTALTLAVQSQDSWREMWVFRRAADGWAVDVLPPAADSPELGYIEFAGWVPGKPQLLAAREAKVNGAYKRSFEVINTDTLGVERKADRPGSLSTFYRWQSAVWKSQTVSLR